MSIQPQDPIVDISSEDESVTYEDLAEQCNTNIEGIIQEKISPNVRELGTFLRDAGIITEKGDTATTICNVAYGKNYILTTPAHIERFFELLDACRIADMRLHYTERQYSTAVSHSGIMLDFDILQPVPESQMTPAAFTGLVRRITQTIFNTIDLADATTCHAFIIRKQAPVLLPKDNEKIYKDGFHILIPDVMIIKAHKEYILKQLRAGTILKTIFSGMALKLPPEEILDAGSIRNPVFFFSHSKIKSGAPSIPYKLDSAFTITVTPEDDRCDVDVSTLDISTLLRGLAPTDRIAGGATAPRSRGQLINIVYELSLTFYTENFGVNPTWLNKQHYSHKPVLDAQIQRAAEFRAGDVFTEDQIGAEQRAVDDLIRDSIEAHYIYDLLQLLHPSYASEYDKWFKVVCAIAHTNTKYKLLARWFSKRAPTAFSEEGFRVKWREAKRLRKGANPATKKSLIFWAKESSPEKFKNLQRANYVAILLTYAYENDGRVEHAMVAKIIQAMWSDRFIVDVMRTEKKTLDYCWYEFVTPDMQYKTGQVWKWRQEHQPDSIHMLLSDFMPSIYKVVEEVIKNRRDAAANDVESKYHNRVLETFKKSKSSLSNDTYQNCVIKQARYRFRDRNFATTLDSYPDHMGVGNGVLKIGMAPTLISSHHELRISKYTTVDYVPFDPRNPYIITLLRAAREIYVEPDVFEFMMCFASTAIDGNEKPPTLVGKQGGGQNGKTFIAKMTQEVIGDMYSKILKPALLTGPAERAEQANEAQMALKEARYGYFDEFNEGDYLNDARVKSIVNPAKQSGRGNYGSQEMFRNTATLEFLTNHFLGMRSTDHGIWRRIYMYTCKMKFCKKPDPANPFEKEEDRRFIHAFPKQQEYLQAWLSILVYWNKKLHYIWQGDIANVPCPTIVRETEIYRNKQDMINCFITSHMIRSPNAERISLDTIVQRYRIWYADRVKGTAASHETVKSQFENSRVGKEFVTEDGVNKYITGYRLRMTLEEVLQPGETMLAAPPAAEKQTPPPGEFNIYDWLIPDMVAIDRDGPKDNAPIPVVFEREIIDDLDQ